MLKRKQLKIITKFTTVEQDIEILEVQKETEEAEKYALRKVSRRECSVDDFKSEVELHRKVMDHPNVIKIIDYFADSRFMYCLLEHPYGIGGPKGPRGNLLEDYVLPIFGEERERTVSKILKQLITVIKDLHQQKIFYLNLSNDSVLMFNNVPKLCDFSLATELNDTEFIYEEELGRIDYESPEIIKYKGFRDSHDIWTIGILAYELMFEETPFESEKRSVMKKNILACDIDFPDCSDDFRDFVSKILVRIPSDRLTLDQMLEHPWITKYNKKKRKKRKKRKKKNTQLEPEIILS